MAHRVFSESCCSPLANAWNSPRRGVCMSNIGARKKTWPCLDRKRMRAMAAAAITLPISFSPVRSIQQLGMLINISEIKERAGKVLRDGFDHKFLNQDNPLFREVSPTPENVARQLYCDVASLFSDVGAKLSVCHLSELPERSATYYFTGACEANCWFEFSAARRTMSPHLSAEENARLFGSATSAPH